LVVPAVATGLAATTVFVAGSFGLNFLFFFMEQANSAENTLDIGVTNYIKISTACNPVENKHLKGGEGGKEIPNM
jgi:hypothetical protein